MGGKATDRGVGRKNGGIVKGRVITAAAGASEFLAGGPADVDAVSRTHVTSGALSRRTTVPSSVSSATPHTTTPMASGIARYRILLGALDLLSGLGACLITMLARGHASTHEMSMGVLLLVLPIVWVGAVWGNRAYEIRILGAGAAEFQLIFRAFLHMTAVIAFMSFIPEAPISPSYVLTTLLVTVGLDVPARLAARRWLQAARARGRNLTKVLAIGSGDAIAEFAELLQRDKHAGLSVVASCLTDEVTPAIRARLAEAGTPVFGTPDDVRAAAEASGAQTVAVLSGQVEADRLRWISWQLEGTDTELVVAPGLTEIAGRRLHIQPVAGLPLLHVDEPEFTGFRRVVKSAFDRSVALVAMLLLAPVLISVALAVRLTSNGPALFRQVRVGKDGREFTMYKFRSMVVDAEQRLAELTAQNESDGVLFKMKDDPRITGVGKVLRRYSIDELPQLLIILNGTMSLVGPRPPLPSEVSRYEDHVHRRLLVKPGLTGPWQVSGRSDLSWEESVRIDLRYVENWSLPLDMVLLWKTFRAVLGRDGAY